MKTRSHRYDVNRTRPRHGYEDTMYKMCFSVMMVMCNKQHLSNIWSWNHDKVKQHWFWIEKSVALKSVYLHSFYPMKFVLQKVVGRLKLLLSWKELCKGFPKWARWSLWHLWFKRYCTTSFPWRQPKCQVTADVSKNKKSFQGYIIFIFHVFQKMLLLLSGWEKIFFLWKNIFKLRKACFFKEIFFINFNCIV